jgi:hypothetical protein
MKWTFKSMNFIKSKIEENLYTFEVKIHDLLHTIIVIKKCFYTTVDYTIYNINIGFVLSINKRS